MKRFLTIMLTLAMILSLTACNNDTTPDPTTEPEVLVGEANGYGGTVTVTVTKEGDTIAKVEVDAPDETEAIAGEAIATLPGLIEAAGGTDGVEAVAGATVTSNAIFEAFNNAISGEAAGSAKEFTVQTFTDDPVGEIGAGLRIGQADYPAHGSSAFTVTTVALDGDTVVAAFIDEYQFMAKETNIGVPNSDEGFGSYYADPERVLGSKKVNNATYSVNMEERGGATMELIEGYTAIETYVKGKTVAELEEIVYGNDDEAVVELVAGSTLVDTRGYIKSVIEAARVAAATEGIEYAGDASALRLNRVEGAAHGTNCFTVAAALTDGTTIVLSWLDEYQFMAGEVVGVPNSDGGFGDYVGDDRALVSKRVNDDAYSANMTERGGATVNIAANFDYVQAFANGKTIAEVKAVAEGGAEEAVELVAGATLVDTDGYLAVIVAAAEAA